jgi:acetolactate synthase small subunit
VGRVASRGEGHGVLVIAGIPLTAQLPDEVGRTADTVRLSVSDVTPERVTLQLEQVIPGVLGQ